MTRAWMISTLLTTTVAATIAFAAPPPPSGPRPRMLLDQELRSTWQSHVKVGAGPVIAAIKLCDQGRTTNKHDRALYQGSAWSRLLQACLVAYAATDSSEHAAGAIKFFKALIDDLDTVGDGRGGDEAARRDSGYSIRNLGPYTALAYDWLHAHPLMTPELKARARQRWKAWLGWYREKGYRATNPGSNYHAGYLIAATLVAVAQAGDAGDEGDALWTHVVDEMWGKEMTNALSADGILSGGNWPEGWQYGPLSVAEYALGARVLRQLGVEVPGITPWLTSVLRHHVYALSPGDGIYIGGDTEAKEATLPPHVLTLSAVALGDATPEDKAWARGEMVRLRMLDRDWLLYSALAAVGDKPVAPPRAAWPTWYLSANTGTLYARTRWDEQAVWLVTECQSALKTDHRHANAGTFVLSRGKDDLIVDPTPYGSASTLTTNAPTVASAHFPRHYIPSQGLWGEKVGYDFITQRASGIVAARCDYADAYKFQHRPSDVPEATRDWVLIPSADGTEAALLVIDRANTQTAARGMHLRFRTPGLLALEGDKATATIGGSKLSIASVARSSPGTTALGRPTDRDCYKGNPPKGQCDAARFPVTEYRVQIEGPRPAAVHVISATAATSAPTKVNPISGKGWAGVRVSGVRDAFVVWRTTGDVGPLAYAAPSSQAVHVVLDALDGGELTATRDGEGCKLALGGALSGTLKPLVAAVDPQCAVTLDPEAAAASAIGTKARRVNRASSRSPRSGCCGAEATPGSSFAMAIVVVGLLVRRRRRA